MSNLINVSELAKLRAELPPHSRKLAGIDFILGWARARELRWDLTFDKLVDEEVDRVRS